MRRWIATLFLAAATAAPAWAEDGPLCASLRSLALLAATGEVVGISLSNAVGGDTVIECGPTNGALRLEFCERVLAPVGMHGMQSYSGRIYDCVRATGIRPFTVPDPSRRAVMLRIAATLDGARLDLSFTPEPPTSKDDAWLYGRYDLVLWKP